jgi:two-component system NtrC family sensor kinase
MKPAILLVDDDLTVLAFTAELLSDRYDVLTACGADEALAILENGDAVDTLVTDVQMPGMHGFELARRAKGLRPTLVILYCTGHPELCEAMGPALGPIVSKPCTPERLHVEIARLHA